MADRSDRDADVSERAELLRRDERAEDQDTRAQRIDDTLIRLTKAHAGLAHIGDDEEELLGRRLSLRDLPRPTLTQLLMLVLALVVFAASATGWVTRGQLVAAVRHVAALDAGGGSILDAATQKSDQNVLVVATDGATATATSTGVAPPAASRADTVTLVHVPGDGRPVVVVSIPPMLETNRPPCPRYDPLSGTYTSETVPIETHTPLRAALESGGPRCLTRVVQQLTGMPITGYIGANLDRFSRMVDAVGGVPVCLARPVQDAVLGPVAPSGGRQTLDGRRTADFVRAGSVTGDPSPDYGRIERQQQVLTAVLDAALSTSGLLDVGQVAALKAAIGGGLITDGTGIDGIVGVARTLHNLDQPGVTFTSAPTAAELNGRGNAVLREAEAGALFAALRRHTQLPDNAGGAATAGTGPGPADMSVRVLNASDKPGRAGQVSETLRKLGFGIGEVSNAPQPTAETLIRFSPDQAAAAALLATSVPAATSVPDPGSTGVLQLVLGRSFDDVVKPPVRPQPAAAATVTEEPAHQAACT